VGFPCQKRQSSKGLLPAGKTSENDRGGGCRSAESVGGSAQGEGVEPAARAFQAG